MQELHLADEPGVRNITSTFNMLHKRKDCTPISS
ncbi:uncharacterized protein FFMR_02062 [Fusarium fujikuroi]|nr:uncharacterized protein FFMR_02062 [Fusarium fujikuroi]